MSNKLKTFGLAAAVVLLGLGIVGWFVLHRREPLATGRIGAWTFEYPAGLVIVRSPTGDRLRLQPSHDQVSADKRMDMKEYDTNARSVAGQALILKVFERNVQASGGPSPGAWQVGRAGAGQRHIYSYWSYRFNKGRNLPIREDFFVGVTSLSVLSPVDEFGQIDARRAAIIDSIRK